MPTYRYESKNAAGKVNGGLLQAAGLAEASQQLRARGEYILALVPADSGKKAGRTSFSFSLAGLSAVTAGKAFRAGPRGARRGFP